MIQISNNYAEALFELSSELGTAHEYLEQLRQFENLLKEEPDYVRFLDAPSIPLSQRCEGLKEALGSVFCEHVTSFLCLLCEKGLIHTVPDVLSELEEMVRCADGVVLCRITSAVELTEKEKAELSSALETRFSKKAQITFAVDSSTIGGIVIEADGMVYDGSLRGKLTKMKDVIKK